MFIKLLFATVAVAAGCAVVLQATINQGLMRATGIGPALVINTMVVLLGTIGLWMATGAKATFLPVGTSWTLYLGGVFGFIVIATAVLVFPRLGAAYAIALMVCGQCIAALVIDHYGLLGMTPSPITMQRAIGVALVAGGVAVFRL